MKKYLYILGGIIISIFFLILGVSVPSLSADSHSDVIGDPITLTLYTHEGSLTGKAVISLPFTADLPDLPIVTVYVDANDNGKFGRGEMAVKHVPSVVVAEFPTTYPVSLKKQKVLGIADLAGPVSGKVILEDIPGGSLEKNVSVAVETFEVTDFFLGTPPGFTGVSGFLSSQELFKVFTANVAHAQIPPGGTGVYNPDVPDLPGRKGHPNECFPVAAANSILWLAKKHNMQDKLPATTDQLLDQLDQAVGYNPQSGTNDNNIVDGKNNFASNTGLPLENERVDDERVEGASTLFGKIEQALKDGKDVELIIKRKTSATGKSDLGHAVTVVGAYTKGKKKYIIVHDVLTPNGNDTYEVGRNGKVEGYSAIPGKWFVEFIITEAIK